MGEGSAHRGRQTEVNRPHAAEVSRPHAEEVSRPHLVEVSRACLVELSRARPVELSSSIQVSSSDLPTYDLQLWKVITLRPNSDLGVLGLYGKPIESRIHPYA